MVEPEKWIAAERVKLFQIILCLGMSADEKLQIEIPDEMPIVVVSSRKKYAISLPMVK